VGSASLRAAATASGSVNISVNPAGLVPNTYNGSVTFSSGANTATVKCLADRSRAGYSDPISRAVLLGRQRRRDSLAVAHDRNDNGAVLSWTAANAPGHSWLVLNRTSGTASDRSASA